jgi:O-antigen ligase
VQPGQAHAVRAETAWTARLAAAVPALLIAWPWVEPWSPAPLANAVPLMVSWACLCALWLWPGAVRALDLARAWAAAALLSAVMGLLQYFGVAELASPWLHVPSQLGEAMGNLRQRNQLATLLNIGMLALLWWRTQGLSRLAAFASLALLAIGLAATHSRTGLLEVWLVLGLSLLWQRTGAMRRTWAAALWALAVYLLASLVLPALLSFTTGEQVMAVLQRMGHDEGCGGRRVLWGNVLTLIGQKPWLGWGWDGLRYAHYITAYPGERFCDILGNAHNLPLHLAVTLGIPVALLLTLGVCAGLWRARPWRARERQHALAWSVLAMIGLHSLLEYPLWYGPFQVTVLLCAALLWPAGGQGTWARLAMQWSQVRPWVAASGWVLIGLVAWDYARVRQIYLPASQRLSLWAEQPWTHARQTWWFGPTVQFAELTVAPVTPDNARWVLQQSLQALHYSPEPRVIHRLIDSAELLGEHELAQLHRERLAAAFPNRSADRAR